MAENDRRARLVDGAPVYARRAVRRVVMENAQACILEQSSRQRKEYPVTGKAAFTEEEWDLLREVPAVAGMMVLTAERGGTFRETFALAKAYSEARKQHGESELLDEIVAAGPKRGDRFRSTEELRAQSLQHLREAAALLAQKAMPDEAEQYRAFVISLAGKVAEAHKEGGEEVSVGERAAIEEIAAGLSPPAQ
jgi:hypothetical protein